VSPATAGLLNPLTAVWLLGQQWQMGEHQDVG
jgi:hypothetical protein